jgi:hypothetical protein
MEAAAHDKEFADKVGIPQSVGREFVEADERKKQAAKKAVFDRTHAMFLGSPRKR